MPAMYNKAGAMKAAVIDAFNKPLTLKYVPIPKPKSDEVLVKIYASGVCHTDLHLADGDFGYTPPIIPGHEGAGVVDKVGSRVEGLKVGDRVGIFFLGNACGACESCLRGHEPVCASVKYVSAHIDGCYAEYVAVNAKFAVKLPDQLTFAQVSAFMCAGLTVYKGIKQSQTIAGGYFCVVGIGGLGHLAVQFAVAMGYRVIAVDIDDSKLNLAKSCGAELVINSTKEDPIAKVASENKKPHGAIVTATSAAAFALAIGLLRPCGTVVFIGLPPNEAKMPLLPITDLIWGCKTIRGSLVGDRADMAECLQFAVSGKVKVKIEEMARLEQINEVFDRLRAGKILGRVVLQMAEETMAPSRPVTTVPPK